MSLKFLFNEKFVPDGKHNAGADALHYAPALRDDRDLRRYGQASDARLSTGFDSETSGGRFLLEKNTG